MEIVNFESTFLFLICKSEMRNHRLHHHKEIGQCDESICSSLKNPANGTPSNIDWKEMNIDTSGLVSKEKLLGYSMRPRCSPHERQ